MRRFFVFLLVALMLCSCAPGEAHAASLTDSIYPYGEVEEYKVFEKAVKEAKDYDTTSSLYTAYINICRDAFAVQKGEYEFCKFLIDSGLKAEAEVHLAKQKAAMEELQAEGGFLASAAKCDYLGLHYYVHKDLTYGIENNSAIKKLYKNYPEEVLSILNEGWRNFYAPAIAGGSRKKAIELFKIVIGREEAINDDLLYSAYSGMVSVYVEEKNWKEAKVYLDKAYSIYYQEPYLKGLEEKINKKLK